MTKIIGNDKVDGYIFTYFDWDDNNNEWKYNLFDWINDHDALMHRIYGSLDSWENDFETYPIMVDEQFKGYILEGNIHTREIINKPTKSMYEKATELIFREYNINPVMLWIEMYENEYTDLDDEIEPPTMIAVFKSTRKSEYILTE